MTTENNKIVAAFLVASIVAMLAGVISRALIVTENRTEETGWEDISTATSAEPIMDLMPKADLVRGEKISRLCGICHTLNKNEHSRISPNLFGIVGKKPGSNADFVYSNGMKNKDGTWNTDTLNEFLWNPKKSIPDTKMTHTGLKKPEDRAAIIKWLETHK